MPLPKLLHQITNHVTDTSPLHNEKRVADDNEILAALRKEYNLLGVIKRLAVAKKGIYDGLAVVEQTPGSEISIEYNKIADMIMAARPGPGSSPGWPWTAAPSPSEPGQ